MSLAGFKSWVLFVNGIYTAHSMQMTGDFIVVSAVQMQDDFFPTSLHGVIAL